MLGFLFFILRIYNTGHYKDKLDPPHDDPIFFVGVVLIILVIIFVLYVFARTFMKKPRLGKLED